LLSAKLVEVPDEFTSAKNQLIDTASKAELLAKHLQGGGDPQEKSLCERS
jgi:hypothetical protein